MISLEYAAGLFDGEGHVGIHVNGGLIVQMTQVDRRPLDAMQERFGGAVSPQHRGGTARLGSYTYNRRRSFQWYLRQGEIPGFLVAVQPHVLVKSSQVELALEYADLRKTLSTTERMEYRERMRLLRV